MQQFPHRQSGSNTPLLIAAAGLGVLLAYALSSPRRRAAIAEGGRTALEAGSRLASTSAERLREWMPERLHDSLARATTGAAGAVDEASMSAADRLHHAADAAGEVMRRAAARARALPAQARRTARDAWDGARDSADDRADGQAGRASMLGPIVAAAAVGAGLYAMRRYGGTERIRQALGSGDNGTIVLDRTLFIDAPIEQVFDTWSNYEHFPRFMSNVQSVESTGGDRSHWKVRGPAGIGVEFDSIAYRQRPNKIGWNSEPGSAVQTDGSVTLLPQDGGTRVQVHLSYHPPAGRVGQAVSSWLGADPRREFDEDLQRMKQFIEGQRASATQPAAAGAAAASVPGQGLTG